MNLTKPNPALDNDPNTTLELDKKDQAAALAAIAAKTSGNYEANRAAPVGPKTTVVAGKDLKVGQKVLAGNHIMIVFEAVQNVGTEEEPRLINGTFRNTTTGTYPLIGADTNYKKLEESSPK